jgi:hypothetical protein
MIQKILSAFFVLLFFQQLSFSQEKTNNGIKHDLAAKTITITAPGKKLSIMIDYSSGCVIKQLNIKGSNTLSPSGVYTGIETKAGTFTSNNHLNKIKATETANGVTLTGISYGDAALTVTETWNFKLTGNKILWDITREYSNTSGLEDMAFPKWNFADLSVWKGGIIDNGGMVWCKYLKQVNDTYSVHTGGVTFWNAKSGDALQITAKPGAGDVIASKYSHSAKNEFTCTQLISGNPLQQRYNLSRFVSQKANVFAPFNIKKGKVTAHFELQYEDYFAKYSRGTLTGIDAGAVRELMNTTGRYGVVDNNIIGANGWLTNWKCLHEPFFAQIGMALDDRNYTRNFSATLNQERDQAMLPDGRVLSRWHNEPGDEIPGTYNTQTGYYEAQWGYTVDSQTGYVINASEQFDLNGDVAWLKSHQQSCEKALDWLLKRDSNRNGIFEMVNNNVAEKKASDWLDIVYAGYENAFVNAQLYEALNLWANCEKIMGNQQKSGYYSAVALRLKTAMNKPVEEGGFWSAAKKQYVYWRDKDGSIHGDNLVTPVNFAVIAFGICDDPQRISLILDQVEQRTTAEKLFHWPLCFDSFKREEVQGGNWPFPKYENGDIFPSWGYLGIRAYAKYNKSIALKYVNNILEQYKKDGLSSQRYSRVTQLGMGDDILAGICTTITGLYRDIYGIRPMWNRMGLEPNMSKTLNGTQFSYTLRDTVYQLKLSVNDYAIRTNTFSVKSNESFGASRTGNKLTYYHHNRDSALLCVTAGSGNRIDLEVNSRSSKEISWTITSPNKYEFIINGLQPGSGYQVRVNNIPQYLKAKTDGSIILNKTCNSPTKFVIKKTV